MFFLFFIVWSVMGTTPNIDPVGKSYVSPCLLSKVKTEVYQKKSQESFNKFQTSNRAHDYQNYLDYLDLSLEQDEIAKQCGGKL